MSSHNRPVDGSAEHSGDTPSAGHNGVETARTSTASPIDAVATPIYDELAARFGLPHAQEDAERSDDAAPGAVEADGASVAMRPAC